MAPPQVRYAHSGDANIAYQVIGAGDLDLVVALGALTNLNVLWDEPAYRRFLERLGERFRGRHIDSAGDGILASFDGPARAIRCGEAIRDTLRGLGLDVRAGVHTGECEVMGDNLAGLAVHIGARVSAAAGAGEILVSGTVHDLVVGSGIVFEDRGMRPLKGVPGEWRLYAVAS